MLKKTLTKDGAPFAIFTNHTNTEAFGTFLYRNYGIMRVLKGGGEWKIGNKTYTVTEGDYVILSEISPRSMKKVYGLFEYNMLSFFPPILNKRAHLLSLFYCKSEQFSHVLRPSEQERKHWDALHDMIVDEIRKEQPLCCEVIENLFVSLVGKCCREEAKICPQLSAWRNQSTNFSYSIAQVVTYIDNNLTKPLDAKTLGAMVGLSRSYLSRIFRESVGISLGKYVNEARVQNVVTLLKKGDVSVLDAAYASGFCSSSGFYKTFRAVTGVPPTAYVGGKTERNS